MEEGPKPIKIYNSKSEFIFSKGKKNISYNKTSKIFKSLENVFPGSKEYDVYAILGYIETKKMVIYYVQVKHLLLEEYLKQE